MSVWDISLGITRFSAALVSGGRYWDRTSDLCRVKTALSR
jgi:hypothetical protein